MKRFNTSVTSQVCYNFCETLIKIPLHPRFFSENPPILSSDINADHIDSFLSQDDKFCVIFKKQTWYFLRVVLVLMET